MAKRIGAARIVSDLNANGFVGGEITYRGETVGRFVTHGGNKGRIVYASRIYSPVKIEVTATKKPALLNKVAKEMATAMTSGRWPVPAHLS